MCRYYSNGQYFDKRREVMWKSIFETMLFSSLIGQVSKAITFTYLNKHAEECTDQSNTSRFIAQL